MNNQDRNFNELASLFNQNIYGTNKGRLRQFILWQDLQVLLDSFSSHQPLYILDAGGGNGINSCQLAAMGHHVIHYDHANVMTEQAKQLAKSHHLMDKITFICAPLQSLEQYINQPFDLILCHAVLEWVVKPEYLLQLFYRFLKKEGHLSLMFYNYDALLFQNVINGNLAYVQLGMPKKKRRTLSPDYPLSPADVYHWLQQSDFQIIQKTGIRVFHDYMKDKQLTELHFEQLLALEQHYCRKEPYIQFAHYLHVIAKK